MAALTVMNNISIAEIAIYTTALLIGVFLSVRHGFGRNAGWLYLIIFSIARILGGSLQLATISQPDNLSLYFGALTLQNVGLSPLILVLLALLNRVLASIRNHTTVAFLRPMYIRLIQTLVLVSLILSSIGGTNAGRNYAETGVYQPSDLSRASIALLIVGYILLVLVTVIVAMHASHADPGEKRLVVAVGLSLPFLLVRLVYPAEGTLGNNPAFSQVTGDPYILLGTAVIMEIIIIVIVEAIGLTLGKRPAGGAPLGDDTAHNSAPQRGIRLRSLR